MQDLQEVEVITFDAGGTLIKPYPSAGAIYAEVLSRYHIILEPSALDHLFHQAFNNIHPKVREKIDEASEKEFWRDIVYQTISCFCPANEFDVIFEELFETFALARNWQTTDGAIPTLQTLKERGYRLAILSNSDSRFRRVFAELGIDTLTETLFISSEIGFEKPDRRIFAHVEDTLGVPPQKILHIGDSPFHDGKGAAEAGWNYFIIEKKDGDVPASFTLSHLADIITLLPECAQKLNH